VRLHRQTRATLRQTARPGVHHKELFARGGDHSPGNLTLLCRAHNTLLAEQDYGKDVMARFRASASRSTVPVDAYGDRIAVQPRWRAPG